MIRLLVLLALAALPLFAGAHEGHRAHAKSGSAPAPAAQPSALHAGVVAVVVAPSRCPGGGHDNCCCHDLTCTPSFQPVAIADAGERTVALAPAGAAVPQAESPAPRGVALSRHSPRGPPLIS